MLNNLLDYLYDLIIGENTQLEPIKVERDLK